MGTSFYIDESLPSVLIRLILPEGIRSRQESAKLVNWISFYDPSRFNCSSFPPSPKHSHCKLLTEIWRTKLWFLVKDGNGNFVNHHIQFIIIIFRLVVFRGLQGVQSPIVLQLLGLPNKIKSLN